jgi:hypothetical protein
VAARFLSMGGSNTDRRGRTFRPRIIYRSPHGYSRDRAITKGGMTVANEGHGYNIEVGFVGGLTPGQQAAFKSAADRWSLTISADVPAAAKPTTPEWSL